MIVEAPRIVKKSLNLFTAAAAVFLFANAPARAADPNLSGEWKLNLAKSDYGKFPTPISVTRKIDAQRFEAGLDHHAEGSAGRSDQQVDVYDGRQGIGQ